MDPLNERKKKLKFIIYLIENVWSSHQEEDDDDEQEEKKKFPVPSNRVWLCSHLGLARQLGDL